MKFHDDGSQLPGRKCRNVFEEITPVRMLAET